MENAVHSFKLDISWQLIRRISHIDRFDASWASIEKKEGQHLKQLKAVATVRSVGASTRIEGANLSDPEVEALLDDIDITKLEDRDSQEVVGYFETLDIIAESYNSITITENSIKNLHNILLKYSQKDQWHRGDYKQISNSVEAKLPDGTTQTIFKTPEPGFPTEKAMNHLISWYHADNETHPLVKAAVFAYDFVSIHPFQDGNGRLSRLISKLLLLKYGYKWIQYVSLEHEIESRKAEYYRVLRSCQAERPGENITQWVEFFFDTLITVQTRLMEKLKKEGAAAQLSPKEKAILTYISNHPGCQSGEIARKTAIPVPTVKRILPRLLRKNLIEKHGSGPATNYTSV